jgi:4-amino-4-deoxy-L-arabinose transferase-like glycosyltransferase
MRSIERIALLAMFAGALAWMATPFFMDIGYDGNAYVAMGDGWRRTHELTMQWGDTLTWGPTPPGTSHHFPPAYGLYLGLFFTVFGFGLAQAKIASVVASLAMLAVVYFCTRDLYGRRAAAVVGALVALDPFVLWVTGMGFSEPLSLLLFTLTMWAILKSLHDERFIVLAGMFAGAAYLCRSSMGAFFLLAGMGGFAWRVLHRGWRATLTSKWYLLAIVVFGTIVGLWAWRNVALYGWPNWETSPGVRGLPRWVAEHPREMLQGLAVRIPLLTLVLAPFLLMLAPEARRSWKRWRDEHTSGLWLSILLVWILGVLFSAAYYSLGPSRDEALRLDTSRYAFVAIVPLAWALVREADFDERRARRRLQALGAILVVGCLLVVAFPSRYLPSEAGEAIDPWLHPGDRVVMYGVAKYAMYASLTHPEDVSVYVEGNGGDPRPEFFLTLWPIERAGYVTVWHREMTHPWWPEEDHVWILARDDIAQARNLTVVT